MDSKYLIFFGFFRNLCCFVTIIRLFYRKLDSYLTNCVIYCGLQEVGGGGCHEEVGPVFSYVGGSEEGSIVPVSLVSVFLLRYRTDEIGGCLANSKF